MTQAASAGSARRALFGALSWCAVLGASGLANAHGAFPQSAYVYGDPSDAERLWIGTSFGLLRSDDGGESFRWLCEEAPDYEGVKPRMAVTADGSLLIGSFDGVSVSRDAGCDWAAPEGPKDRFVSSLFTTPHDPNGALAMVSTGMPGGVFLNQVWVTGDNGQSFTQRGADLEPGMLAFSLMSATSDPSRLYLTGNVRGEAGVATGQLGVSRDGGLSWDYLPIPGADSTHPPHLLAIHPGDAEQLFVRVDGPEEDVLLWSQDAGLTFTELLRKPSELFGFVIDPDLNRVRVGFGNAADRRRNVEVGIYSAALKELGTASFAQDLEGPIGCLTWLNGQLYACTSQFFHGYELGRSSDGRQFEGVMTLAGVEGVASCGEGTRAAQVCPAKWPENCNLIGRCGQVEPPDAGPDAGPMPNAPPARRSGCQLTQGGNAGASWLLLSLGLLFARRRRR
ncbi:MAG: hypothetical protein KIT72_13850 [Polyangiaceae bacterium]|nr:hypothetical protein [Polyangiaceae bacterium]MCW5791495.1 hypothetical protein [Polyangiaceae bacterium]